MCYNRPIRTLNEDDWIARRPCLTDAVSAGCLDPNLRTKHSVLNPILLEKSYISKLTIVRQFNCYHSRLPNPLPLKKSQKAVYSRNTLWARNLPDVQTRPLHLRTPEALKHLRLRCGAEPVEDAGSRRRLPHRLRPDGNLRGNSRERGDNIHRHISTQLHVDIPSLSSASPSSMDCLRLYRVRRGRGRCRDHSAHDGDREKGTMASRSHNLTSTLSALHHKIVKSIYLPPTSVGP